MELDAKKICMYVRKGLIFSTRICYESAHDHPFVFGMVIFSFLLYRFLPSVFAFLVSSSPVLFCTAVLLGTLLSFGNPDIPEVEEDEKKTHEISSLKTGVVAGDHVVEKDESFAVETHVERREVEEKAIEEAGLGGEDVVLNKVEKDAISSMARDVGEGIDEALIGRSIVIEEDVKEHHGEKQEIGERVYGDQGFVDKQESHENLIERVSEVCENIEGHHIDEQEKENEGPADEILNLLTEKRVDSSLGHSEYDSDSDGSESSSPDASMADIMPMLDELHPLLDFEAPQPAHIPVDDSDASSQGSSHESDEGSAESGEDGDNQEEAHEDQEDKTEAVVKWTEDDQKNLMDLGTSELERNRRLENLIAKRMARKHQRIAIEKNLIDLDNNDVQTTLPMSGGLDHIQFQVPPISTARRNPFDFPYDSNEIGGLPPIPGSAPSVLLPRRNPFDLPYERLDDRGSLTGETSSYQEEFMSAQERERHFRRHESFTSGGPFSLESRQDKHAIKLKPYFVPEGITSGQASHATFQRQLSEMSDSKLSSVPDTDTVSSVGDQEQEHVLLQDLHQEGDVISLIERSAEPFERVSGSEVDHVEIGREGNDINFGDANEVNLHASEIIEEAVRGTSEARETSSPVSVIDEEFLLSIGRPNVGEMHDKSEVVEENYKGLSSSSSEASERIFEMNADKELGEEMEYGYFKGSSESINLAHAEGPDCGRVEVPVYDLSPSDIEKSLSNMTDVAEDFFYMNKRVFNSTSSISSDTHIEVLDRSIPPVTVEKSFTPGTKDAASDNLSVEKGVVSGDEVSWVASSSLSAIEENKLLQSREVAEIGEHDVFQASHSEVHHHDDSVEPMIPKPIIEQVLQASWENKLIEGGLMDEKENQQFQEFQIPLSAFDEEIHVGGLQLDVERKMDAATVTYSDGVFLSDASQQTQLLVEESAAQLPSKHSHEETEDLSLLQTKSSGEIKDGDTALKQAQESKDGVLLMETEEKRESPSILTSEQKSTTNLVQLDDDTLDRLQSEQEVNVNLVTEENEEADEMKEIDEGLLLELDSVGDFSVKELRSPGEHIKADEQFDKQTHVDISTDSLIQMECESLPDHKLSEAAELQFVTDQSKSKESGVANEELEPVDQENEPEENSFELQVVEAASVADIDLAFKQPHKVEYKKLASLESIDDKSSSVIAEVGSTQLELEERDLDLGEIDSALHILEANSLEDIDSAFKNFHKGDVEKCVPVDSLDDEPIQVESRVSFSEPLPNKNDLEVSEIHSDVHVLEARSIEDANSGFEQLLGGDLEKSSSLESVNNKPKPVEFEVGSPESALPVEHPELIEVHSDMHILEAGTLEDTDSAIKQPQEVNTEHSIKENLQLLDSEVGCVESTSDENHAKQTETHSELLVLEAKSLEDIDSAFKQMQDGEAKRYPSLELVEEKPHYVEYEVRTADSVAGKKPSEPIDTYSDLNVLEVSSLAVADSGFKQLQGGLEKSVSIELAESEIMSAESVPGKKVSVPTEIHSDLHVVEVGSLEDIDSDLNKLHEGGLKKSLSFGLADDKPKPLESEPVSAENVARKEHLELTNTHSDFQVLEATSHEYNDSTFKQIDEDGLEKSISLESVHAGSADKNDLDLIGTSSVVQVHKTSSIEVIQLDLKHVSEGSDEDPPKPIESEDKPADFEAIERHLEPIILMRSVEEIQAALKESAARESGTSSEELTATKSNKGVIETCDDSTSGSPTSGERLKKEGSGKSSSNSSSSSSSSSSDSD